MRASRRRGRDQRWGLEAGEGLDGDEDEVLRLRDLLERDAKGLVAVVGRVSRLRRASGDGGRRAVRHDRNLDDRPRLEDRRRRRPAGG
jgi:hypothetical protein